MVLAVGNSVNVVSSLNNRIQAIQPVATQAVAQTDLPNFISPRIRVDNNLDMAILEFRSSATGDVIQQYPTEQQIRAMQRAAELEARIELQNRQERATAPIRSAAPAPQATETADAAFSTASPQTSVDFTIAAPTLSVSSAPAQLAPSAPIVSVETANVSTSGADTGGRTQSSAPQSFTV